MTSKFPGWAERQPEEPPSSDDRSLLAATLTAWGFPVLPAWTEGRPWRPRRQRATNDQRHEKR